MEAAETAVELEAARAAPAAKVVAVMVVVMVVVMVAVMVAVMEGEAKVGVREGEVTAVAKAAAAMVVSAE